MKMSQETFDKIEECIIKCSIEKWNTNSSSRYVAPKEIQKFYDGDLARTQEIGMVMKKMEFLEKHNKNNYWISDDIVNHNEVGIKDD